MRGKVKTKLQKGAVFIVVLLMFPHSQGLITDTDLTYVSTWVVGIAASYSVISVFDYVYANRRYIGCSLIIRRNKNYSAASTN